MMAFRAAVPTVGRRFMLQRKPMRHHNQPLRSCSRLCSISATCKRPPNPEKEHGKNRSYHESGVRQAVRPPSLQTTMQTDHSVNLKVPIQVDGRTHEISALFLRDLCQCHACVHEFTNQKLYSTTDIPPNIEARSVRSSETKGGSIDILWSNDVPGFEASHTTTLNAETLRGVVKHGATPSPFSSIPSPPVSWDASSNKLPDFDYHAYMEDDATLLGAIEQLQTHGLVFVTGVPGVEKSVSAIAERIGPIKDTFYGRTWDVRTVPKAINAAYTSNDLGFHTDLLYFQNPPHIQLLHCIQSSSSGGASVFADAFKCASDLYDNDMHAFNVLATLPVNYHYKHPASNLYSATKPVFDMRPLRIGSTSYPTLYEFLEAWNNSHGHSVKQMTGMNIPTLTVTQCLDKINWGPPFMAPFSLQEDTDLLNTNAADTQTPCNSLNEKISDWHAAARKFAALLERPEILHERLMRPGECVLFNNTRVLHSRRRFSADDVGKARWLRGTYVDRDPFFSKYRVLHNRFGS